VVDYGSRAPVAAFLDLFQRHGVSVPIGLARRFMGAHKREHIRLMLEDPGLKEQWQSRNAAPANLDALYSEFIPLQLTAIRNHSQIIPGVVDAATALRQAGIRIGATTGYTREMMDVLEPQAAAQGFTVEAGVCADEVPEGRPAPWMALQAAMLLNAWPISCCVKVGDTVADVQEGRNAGMWTVAVTLTGNEIGLTEQEAACLPQVVMAGRLDAARHKLLQAGAHYVIDSVADLMAVLEDIDSRLEVGARP
jgi:phosphonoacetaldehyde hydrolase